MEPLRRTRLQATGLLAITFVVGALVGAAGERVLKAREPATTERIAGTRERPDHNRGPGRRPSIWLDPIVLDQIGATPAQRSAIQLILARRDSSNRKLWERIEPDLHQLMEQTRQELRNELTAEQQTKLDQIIKERRARMKEQREAKGKQDSTQGKTEKQP